jgi:hypothetical protein
VVGSLGATRKLVIRNVGDATASGVKVNAGVDFKVESACAVLGLNATCEASVTFAPLVAGKRMATLLVTDSASPASASAALTGMAQFRLTLVVASDPECLLAGAGSLNVEPGTGTCRLAGEGIVQCIFTFDPGTTVRLTAVPSLTSSFRNYTGCQLVPGSKTVCTVPLTQNLSVRAEFCGGS